MSEERAERNNPVYKLYILTTPHVRSVAEVPHSSETRLLDDLHDMDEDGWEIAHVFASGTHILMKRKADARPPAEKRKKEQQT